MGIFSGLKRGGDKKKKAAKYHAEQPGIAEKDILNQAFLGDDPYLRVGGPAKLFPGNEGIRPHDYRPGTPGSEIDSIYGAPAHGSGYGSSRQQSPAVLQPPQFSQFSNNSALNLPSRPWSSGTNNGPQDDRPSTSHGPGTKQWGSNATTFESRFGPAHRRTDTQGTATPASRPGSRAGSVAGVPQSPQSPRSPAHSSRHTKSQTSNMDKNLSTSSASPTENSETSQHTSATATTTSEGQRATSPPSTVSDHSRPTSSADKAWPVANPGSPASKSGTSSPTPKSPTSPKDTRARDAAKKKDLAIKVPRRRSWSAQINQLEKAWLEEQLSPKYQDAQKEAVPLGSQLEVTEEKDEGEEKEAVVPVVSEEHQVAPAHAPAPAPPANVAAPPQNSAFQQQRMSPQDFPQQRQEMPRQSPRVPQGPMPGPRGHMASQSAQQFPIRRGPPPPPVGRSFDHSFDPSFDPQFDPRNMSRNDPRGDTRFDTRAAPRQGPPRQMPGPPGGQRERGRTVDYNFMPSSIDQYGGVGGGPYAMGRTSRVAPPGVQMPEVSQAAPRSASGGAQRHRQMLSDVDFSTTIDMGGRMPETRLPAALRGSQSMQQLPRPTRDARGPMPMSPPHSQAQNQGQYHSRAGSMASQVSQGSHYNRGHAHPQQQHGMRSASSQGMRSPQYPLALPTVSMRDGGNRYPAGPGPAGSSMAQNMGPGPGPRRLPHSSSADLTVYRDQHHQYGSARSPMGSPGYGPGPRSSPNSGPGLGLDQGHPHQQFGPPMDRRNIEPRSDNRADPRYLNMPSPASPGAFDRQLSDVAEDIEEKSVLDMPGVAVKDFASKKDGSEPAESASQDGEASGAAGLNAESIPSDLPPPYSPGPNAVAVVAPVEPTETLPVVVESEAEVQELSPPAEVREDQSVNPVESYEAIGEAVSEPVEPEVDTAEPTPAATKTTPKLSFVEPTRSISPAYSNSSSTEKSASTRPMSPAFTNFPLTPVTPSVEKMPSHTVSNSISFSRSIEEPTRSSDERSPERSQAIAERRRTRYPTRDNNTPPDTPIIDAMPPSPVYVAPVVETTEDTEEVEDARGYEHDEAADISTDATSLTNVDASRPETPVVLAKEEPTEIEAEEVEAEIIAQPTEEFEELKQVDTEATEPEVLEAEAVIETGRAEIVEATAAPIIVESTGADIVETVVAVYPRSGSGATNYSSPPMSPISLPSGDAEPSVNANWPLPSVFVSPASRSGSPSSPTSPAMSLAEAIAGPAPSVQAVPTIVAPEDADTKSIDDTSSEDEKDTDSVDEDRLMGALPSPTRKTAFTASIYAKDIGIGPYAFDDTTLSSLSAIDKPSEPVVAEHEVNTDCAFGIVRPSTPTSDKAPSQMVIASPESTYSWGGDEVIAVSARQSDEIVEASEKAEEVKAPEVAQTTELAEPAEMVKSVPEEKKEAGLMDVPPESIGLARGPSILADMDTLSPRGKRRWNIAHHADQETLQERLMEVASPAVRTEGFAAIVPTSPVSPSRVSPMLPNSPASPTATSPTRKVKKGPPPPLTSVPQFNRHVPTDVVDKFGTTFI